MIYSLPVHDLKVGMYVLLPDNWFAHPFLKHRFLITTDKQLKKIQALELESVQVDSSRSQVVDDFNSITHPLFEHPSESSAWNSEQGLSQELREVIYSSTAPPQDKARAVYSKSLDLMEDLFNRPVAEVIKESKSAITAVTDLILNDEDTSHNLLRITSHDFYTYTHSVNVGILSLGLAKRLYQGDRNHNLAELGAGFFLHDLGKVMVDPKIINKPGRLTDDEMKQMRIHPFQSFKILESAGQLSEECRVICMQHHEREDGTGYPRRLQGDQIHDYARICCIADVYDALTAQRSYKPAHKPFDALRIMKEEMLGFFHEEIFKNFVLLFKES
jgi:HD-GYP domain-containing protein (c-di-GMP phosphodiesterase class II)